VWEEAHMVLNLCTWFTQ